MPESPVDPLEQLRHAYRAAFGSEYGRTVLDDLAAFTGDGVDLFDPDPHVTAFRLGGRRVLLRIRALLVPLKENA